MIFVNIIVYIYRHRNESADDKIPIMKDEAAMTESKSGPALSDMSDSYGTIRL